MRIGIAGAGLLGRLCAFRLNAAGHEVTLFDANPLADPGVGGIRAAAWTAAGMLSPIAEMETGGEAVRALGERSLVLWQDINQELARSLHSAAPATNPHRANDPATDWEGLGSPLGLQLHDSLMVCHASDLGSAQRVLRLLASDSNRVTQLQASDIGMLAPELKGTLYAWRLLGEGHLYPALAMHSLHKALHTAHWRLGKNVSGIEPKRLSVDGQLQEFDWVLDTRGVGASGDLPVRGVRGEVIVLFAPGFELHRPVRLLHPRWRVYIVPRPNSQVVIGATEIESEDRSPISVQSAMELLSAAFSIFPTLSEARILWTDVNLRPATPDNLPLIENQPGLTRINGLFRHGWLLAPAVVEKALADADLC